MDINEIIYGGRFSLETDTLGILLGHHFVDSVLSSLRNEFANFIDIGSTEFVRKLITLVCQQDVKGNGEYTDERITQGQVVLLTEDELVRFSQIFINKNSYLLCASKSEWQVGENGEQVIVFLNEPRTGSEKLDGEQDLDYLKRIMHQYRLYTEEQTKNLFDKLAPKSIFSESLIGLIDQNRRISDRIGNSITTPQVEFAQFSKNPGYETNKQLKIIGDEIRETTLLVKNMNDLGLQMAFEMAESAKNSKRHNTIMIYLGLITLFFSAIMSYLSYVSSSESANKVQGLLLNSNNIQESILENNQNYTQQINRGIINVEQLLSKVELGQEKVRSRIDRIETQVSGISE